MCIILFVSTILSPYDIITSIYINANIIIQCFGLGPNTTTIYHFANLLQVQNSPNINKIIQ